MSRILHVTVPIQILGTILPILLLSPWPALLVVAAVQGVMVAFMGYRCTTGAVYRSLRREREREAKRLDRVVAR